MIDAPPLPPAMAVRASIDIPDKDRVIAVYYRVSKAKDIEDEFYLQRHQVEAYVKAKFPGSLYELLRYEEVISGVAAERAEFNRLMADARAGVFNTLVVYKLDRFGRRSIDILEKWVGLISLGVDFRSATQPIFEVPYFRAAVIGLYAEMAETERDNICQRIKHGLQARKAAGHKLGRKPKLTKAQVEQVLAMRQAGHTYRAIAQVMKVSSVLICHICHGIGAGKRYIDMIKQEGGEVCQDERSQLRV